MRRLYHFMSFLVILAFCSCQGHVDKGAEPHFVIASLKGPSSVGMLQMMDSINHSENADVEIVILNEPMQARKMMLDGSADFAILPTTMAALMYNKEIDYRLVAVPMWGTLYLCGNDSTVHTWNDLKGRMVYLMAKGMTPDVLFRHLLMKNGLEPYKDVDLDYRFPTHIDLANATMAGRADMSVLSEPYLSLAIEQNHSLHLLLDLEAEWSKAEGIALPETAFICRGDLVKSNPALIDALVKAYARSVDWVNGNADSAAVRAVKYGIIADTVAARNSIPRSNLKVLNVKDARTQVEEYLKVFYDMEPQIIGDKMPDEKFYR